MWITFSPVHIYIANVYLLISKVSKSACKPAQLYNFSFYSVVRGESVGNTAVLGWQSSPVVQTRWTHQSGSWTRPSTLAPAWLPLFFPCKVKVLPDESWCDEKGTFWPLWNDTNELLHLAQNSAPCGPQLRPELHRKRHVSLSGL